MYIHELPYREDTTRLFSHWAHQPWAVLLDSGAPFDRQGRFDIFTADPRMTLVTRGPVTEVRDRHGIRLVPDDPFQLVRQALGALRENDSGLPFCGGAIGCFAYDLAWRIERLPRTAQDYDRVPDMAVGIYDWAVVVDHHQRRSFLVAQDQATMKKLWPRIHQGLARSARPVPAFRLLGPVVSHLSRHDYIEAFERIQSYIREGDCYQVNFAHRFSAAARGDPWAVYLELRETNPAPFSAFLRLPQLTVLSSSPERFLRLRDGHVETRPIKGTRPRRFNPEEDLFQIQALAESTKDRAENLMIVDLLRNDLSKTCRLGSVKVPSLFQVESFATVHHLVSTVTGRLEPGRHALELLRHCFPGGSITGAPKIRAMEIIEELEGIRRGIYCGAIGYIGYDGAMDTNIVIRTMVHAHDRIHFWAGGGIVADSKALQEYQESYDKAAALIKVLTRFQKATGHVGG